MAGGQELAELEGSCDDDEGHAPGKGREVEIGAFLSEEERVALYGELLRALRAPAAG